jgi:hypothetical protein
VQSGTCLRDSRYDDEEEGVRGLRSALPKGPDTTRVSRSAVFPAVFLEYLTVKEVQKSNARNSELARI